MELFQDLLNIRDSLSKDNPFCYVYVLHNNQNNIDKLILMTSPNVPFEGRFPHLLVKYDDNNTLLSNGLEYLLESECLENGTTLNRLFNQLEQGEQDITTLLYNRTNIIESICRIAGKGPFKTATNTIMIIEKNGKKFVRKIDKSAKEINHDNNSRQEKITYMD